MFFPEEHGDYRGKSFPKFTHLTCPTVLSALEKARWVGGQINSTEQFMQVISLRRSSLQDSKIMALREEIKKEFLELSSLSSNTKTAHCKMCLLDNLHCDAQHWRLAITPKQHLLEILTHEGSLLHFSQISASHNQLDGGLITTGQHPLTGTDDRKPITKTFS